MTMRKLLAGILTVSLLFSLTGCSFGEDDREDRDTSSQRELYKIGLDLIETMDEMINSEEYAALMVNNNNLAATLDHVNTGDYDTPVAVYQITPPAAEEMLELMANGDAEDLWDGLSEDLKEQVINRVSFSTMVTFINSRQGASVMAFCSVFTATKRVKSLSVDDTKIFLYVFEKGTPIVVTYTDYAHVTGQFLFLEDIHTLSDVREVFEEIECSVEKVNIP